MDVSEFGTILNEQFQRSSEMLLAKRREYADDYNVLHNFLVASQLQGVPMHEALAGMMAKHTVSVYDMCSQPVYDYDLSAWDEKITDHINYLILLRAVLVEEKKES